MKNILLVVMLFLFLIVLSLADFGSRGRVYDCGMAEWHPDIPTNVKEECRRLRYEEWKKQNDVSKYRT